jgi:hypothetical protein
MKMRLNGVTMVAVGIASMTAFAGCDTGGGDGTEVALQDPTTTFIVDDGTPKGDTTKACASRPDVAGSVALGTGSWGSYQACYSFCPAGSFAYAATLRSEVGQGLGDDSALNGISIDCYNRSTGAYTGSITSNAGFWGTWGTRAVTNPYMTNNPFVGGQMKIEAPQGVDDDTAANAINLLAANGNWSTPSANTGWGSWGTVRQCPGGQAICGVNTRVESPQGGGDDTALNGISVACCTF